MADAIPGKMTAVEIFGPGGPEVLKLVERLVPAPVEGGAAEAHRVMESSDHIGKILLVP